MASADLKIDEGKTTGRGQKSIAKRLESKAFGTHSTAHPCETTMLRLAESRAGHASGALVSASDSEAQDA